MSTTPHDGTLVLSEDFSQAYFSGTGLAVSTGLGGSTTKNGPPLKSTTSRRKPDGEEGSINNVIANWGHDNLLPNRIIADVETNPELAQTMDWKARALISGGLVYGYLALDAKGRRVLVPVIDDEVEEWLERTNVKRYLREITKDYYILWHGFTEMMMTPDGKKVAGIACQDTAYCRFALQDERGRIKYVYITANWDMVSSVEDETVNRLPLLDPHFDVQNQLALGGQPRYVYPTAGTATGRTYYQPAPWHSLRIAWLPLANSIPKFKIALMRNQYTIKYHLEIADWWWKMKYPDWDKEPAKRADWIKATLELFNKKMQGDEAAGSSIISMIKYSPDGTAMHGWKITAIDDKIPDGKYIEDSQEAGSHTFFAQGVDPTLIGAAPGKGVGAGSGSDKRVAQNIWTLNSKPEQDIILEPVQAAFKYNQFGAKNGKRAYTVWFENYYVSTLDSHQAADKEETGGEGAAPPPAKKPAPTK